MVAFTPESLPDLSNRICFVTGGNAGIGYETALHLARKNAKVYIGARSETKGRAAISSIQALVPGSDIHLIILDHMDLSSVVAASQEFKSKESKLHILINNAGIMAVPFEKSKDGWESQWQTNYISHWLLTHHLLPTLLATAKASQPGDVRVINVTSTGHSFAPKAGIAFDDINLLKGGVWSRYGQSKLGNILHAKYLHSLFGPEGSPKNEGEIWTAAVHPGNVYTDLSKKAGAVVAPILNLLGVYTPAERASYTTVFCAASGRFQGAMSGEYFVPVAKVGKPSKLAKNGELAERLWQWSERELKAKALL